MIEDRIEYHRNAVALIPEPDDPDPGLVIMVIGTSPLGPSLICDCRKALKNRNCAHAKAQSAAIKDTPDFDSLFRQSI